MASIRCIKNCILTVLENGEEAEQSFGYGQWLKVKRVEAIDDEYINIIFHDDSAIAGVQKSIFELGYVDLVNAPIDTPVEVVDRQEAPPDEPNVILESPLSLPVDIIGNKEPTYGKPTYGDLTYD